MIQAINIKANTNLMPGISSIIHDTKVEFLLSTIIYSPYIIKWVISNTLNFYEILVKMGDLNIYMSYLYEFVMFVKIKIIRGQKSWVWQCLFTHWKRLHINPVYRKSLLC